MEGNPLRSEGSSRFSKDKLALEDRFVVLRSRVDHLMKELEPVLYDENLRHKIPLQGDPIGDKLWPVYLGMSYGFIDYLGGQFKQGKVNEDTNEYEVPGGSLKEEERALTEGYHDEAQEAFQKRKTIGRRINAARTSEELSGLETELAVLETQLTEGERVATETGLISLLDDTNRIP